MASPRIAIFGASGLLGTALCERLYFEQGPPFRAMIHSAARAWRLARLPVEIRTADVREYNQVREATAGCEIVVNCVMGGKAALVRGLENILKAAVENKVQRYVHIGSIAVYGDDPGPECASENAPARPTTEYGRCKSTQDEMVRHAHRRGLPSVNLISGHIYGPYSSFLVEVLDSLRAGQLPLVDGGEYPTNGIHVDNLVEAVLTVIRKDAGWGQRYFVTEAEDVRWKRFYGDLREMLGAPDFGRDIPREAVLSQMKKARTKPGFGLRPNLRALMSGEFRKGLSVLPAFARANEFAYARFMGLPPRWQERIRHWLQGPQVVAKRKAEWNLAARHIAAQVRRIHFSPQKAIQQLGYGPVLNYEEGLETIRQWGAFFGVLPVAPLATHVSGCANSSRP
jgi:nucleoside-diphosphate-sugar epimerase